KWLHINQIVKERKIGILTLQETHLTPEDETLLNETFKMRLRIILSIDPDKPNAKGVAVVINKHTTNSEEIKKHTLIAGRAMLVIVPWHKDNKLVTLVVYAPNDPTKNADFWETI
ncbi:hypothetical protein F4604DRAFT_1510869, partial [Suillus subluteus]